MAGTPRPQGSKRAFKLPNGRVSMVESSKGLGDWRGDVKAQALRSYRRKALMEGPLHMVCLFQFTRPKAHYRTGKKSHLLRDDAPHFVTKAPDATKLLRAIEDALEGVVFSNDAQVVRTTGVKFYVDREEKPGAYVIVESVDEGSFHRELSNWFARQGREV